MKKIISTVLACTVLFCLAACNTDETTETTTASSEETTVAETSAEATETEATTESVTETTIEGMRPTTLDEITDRFIWGLEFNFKEQDLVRTKMDPNDAGKNALCGIKDYSHLLYDNAVFKDKDEPESWFTFDVYIFELDMEMYQYKKPLSKGDKIRFLLDPNTGVYDEREVAAIRGQYVLCIKIEEGKNYKKTLDVSLPDLDSGELSKAYANFMSS